MDNDDSGASPVRIAPGYAALQLSAALTTQADHPDEQVRERARLKAQKWAQVMNGMLDQSIAIGSRTPLAAVPAWATLDVVRGGFATGDLKAGGPLLDHELQTLAALGVPPSPDARRLLNTRLLTDEGLANLHALLDSGCYDITVPEEGALLVAAWLIRHRQTDAARDLLGDIAPWFDRLRFYPVPSAQPRQLGERVFLRPVRRVAADLKSVAPNQAILAQRETVRVWLPLYDRLVALFLDTVEGEPPSIEPGVDGAWRDGATGKFYLGGGWPCRRYPDQWRARADALLSDYNAACTIHRGSTFARRAGDSFAELIGFLRICANEPAALSGRDVGKIRLILGRYVAKRGLPGSEQCGALRAKQARQTDALPHQTIARLLAKRLRTYQQDAGVDDIGQLGHPVTETEAHRLHEGEGTPIPPALLRKLERCRTDTVSALVDAGLIRSAEVLATVLPQISAAISGAAIGDRHLKQLYGAIYQAFRRRRSLLLLNLENQVQLTELPWVAAIEPERKRGMAPRTVARKTLEEVTMLTLTAFPQTVIPNKLLQELRALANSAELKLPIVDELAADIFMGEFSDKFTQAAAMAGAMLDETLYAAYYGIDAEQIRAIAEAPKRSVFSRAAATRDRRLMQLCEARAGIAYGDGGVTGNGMLIEQQQILTSQNLAVLVSSLGLGDELWAGSPRLAQRCFEWICQRHKAAQHHWHDQFITIKNSAYAWRQMVFFLSLYPGADIGEFIGWARAHLAAQGPALQKKFGHALAGLELAAAGHSLDDQASLKAGARRLLAYSMPRHWMMDGE